MCALLFANRQPWWCWALRVKILDSNMGVMARVLIDSGRAITDDVAAACLRSLRSLTTAPGFKVQSSAQNSQSRAMRPKHTQHSIPTFPVYSCAFLNDGTFVLGGGGGAARSGIKNKLVCGRMGPALELRTEGDV